jgi:hypothetical protein
MYRDSVVAGRGELKRWSYEAAEDPTEGKSALGCEDERTLGGRRGDCTPEPVRADVCAAGIDRRTERVSRRVLELGIVWLFGKLADANVNRPGARRRGSPRVEGGLNEASSRGIVGEAELEAKRPGDLVHHLRPL